MVRGTLGAFGGTVLLSAACGLSCTGSRETHETWSLDVECRAALPFDVGQRAQEPHALAVGESLYIRAIFRTPTHETEALTWDQVSLGGHVTLPDDISWEYYPEYPARWIARGTITADSPGETRVGLAWGSEGGLPPLIDPGDDTFCDIIVLGDDVPDAGPDTDATDTPDVSSDAADVAVSDADASDDISPPDASADVASADAADVGDVDVADTVSDAGDVDVDVDVDVDIPDAAAPDADAANVDASAPIRTIELTVAATGVVDSAPAGLSCTSGNFDITAPTSCSAALTNDAIVLTAQPDAAFGFVATAWSGGCARTTDTTCQVDPGTVDVRVVACFHDGSVSAADRCHSTFGF